MAFVARTTRETNRVGMITTGSTSVSLGPGSYAPTSSFRNTKPGFVPFASTSTRPAAGESGESAYTPGPGTYNLAVSSFQKTSASTGFGLATSRFKVGSEKKRATPGPGSYKAADMWVKPQYSLQGTSSVPGTMHKPEDDAIAAKPAVTWQRLPSAPSIPALHQSFGYKEKQGRLIMQRAPESVIKRHPVGPGEYYRPDVSSMHKKNVLAFSKSKTRRTDFTALKSSVPGPGHYAAASAAAHKRRDERAFSAFASKTKRGMDAVQSSESGPGPGSYAPKGIFDRIAEESLYAESSSTMQQFGTKSLRFAQSTCSGRDRLPGPGQYATQSAFGARKRRINTGGGNVYFSREYSNGNGFNSTSKRFGADSRRAARASAGPNYAPPGMASLLEKKLHGRRNVFGSTTRRFVPSKADSAPGPGAYGAPSRETAASKGKRGKNAKGSAAFISSSGRWNGATAQKQAVPEPGQYNVAIPWTQKQGKGVMESGSTRFRKNAAAASQSSGGMPGPGAYNLPKTTLRQPHKPIPGAKHTSFATGSPRFRQQKPSTRVPGPGSYDIEYLYGNLNKQTFNTTIAAEQYTK